MSDSGYPSAKNCLRFINSSAGEEVQRIGARGTRDNQFQGPFHICRKTIDADMCHIIVSDFSNHCIKIFTHNGVFVRKLGRRGAGHLSLNGPRGVCVDYWGRIIVCDSKNRRVVCFTDDAGSPFLVLLTTTDLYNMRPARIDVSSDASSMVVGLLNSDQFWLYNTSRSIQ